MDNTSSKQLTRLETQIYKNAEINENNCKEKESQEMTSHSLAHTGTTLSEGKGHQMVKISEALLLQRYSQSVRSWKR